MSWDRFKYDKYSRCACGKGRVIAHCWEADDDWNRHEEGIYGYEIQCPDCGSNYHIDSITRYFPCPKWKREGCITDAYLVPNNLKIPEIKTSTNIILFSADEDIVSKFTPDKIKLVISDMKESKYSTRVCLPDSKRIIGICSKRLNTKSLKKIIPILQEILYNYKSYRWNPTTIAEYKKSEQLLCEENERQIAHALSQSYLLVFEEL